MKKWVTICAVVCIMMASAAQAYYVNVVECRLTGGAQNPLYSQNGPAISSGKSTAAPLLGWTGGNLTGTGNYYAGDSTPVKWGEWMFNVPADKGGYYDVYATWVNVTAAQNMPPIWTINSADPAVTASPAQTTGGNAWNLLAAGKKFNAGTGYVARLATPGTGTTGKRASFDSVAWAVSLPGAPTNTGPANGATGIPQTGAGNELAWTAGASSSFFDVYLDINTDPVAKVGSNLTGTSFDPDSLSLMPNTTYYWKIVAGNVDRSAGGAVYSFTTLPEPGAIALLVLGSLGSLALRRRRRA